MTCSRPVRKRQSSWSFLVLRLALVVVCTSSLFDRVQSDANTHHHNKEEEEIECKLYLAPSTIPSAGLGIFAGTSFERDDMISSSGDVVISIRDIDFHNGNKLQGLLWDIYTWTPHRFTGMDDETVLMHDPEDLVAASPGIGAVANCIVSLVNVDEFGSTTFTTAGVPSSNSASGSSSPYQGRKWYATKSISSGSELFIHYGDTYFEKRVSLGPIPLSKNYRIADFLLGVFQFLETNFSPPDSTISSDLWKTLQDYKRIWSSSRTMAALPNEHNRYQRILESGGTANQFYNETLRDQDWLKKNGHCIDGLRDGQSAIPNAGMGAFASKKFRKGSIVTTTPLIQIPDKKALMMYDTKPSKPYAKQPRRDPTKPIHQQLLLNYCWGHPDSDLLLSPYGMQTSLINCANHDRPNVKLQWSSASSHDEWRQLPLSEWSTTPSTGLAWDFVALEDIEVDDEILIDCGYKWRHAWEAHQHGYSMEHLPADEWNSITDPAEKPSLFDLDLKYYRIQCPRVFGVEQFLLKSNSRAESMELIDCEPVSSWTDPTSGMEYYAMRITVNYIHKKDKYSKCLLRILWNVPSELTVLSDAPVARSDLHRRSFRHEMMIPDEIFPPAWKRRSSQEENFESGNCTLSESKSERGQSTFVDLPEATSV